jgi:DNA invertase Pin-like site-specific DNA recombinase
MKRAAIYCRVSTTEQTVENQRLAIEQYCKLQNWKVVKIYEDVGVSGAQDRREGLDGLKTDVSLNRFDVVIVWKFDRLARSTAHLLEVLSLLQRYGVDFVSVTEAVDSSTAAGKMVLTFLGAIGEFERSLIRERVVCGLARARTNGTKLGRPRVFFDFQRAIQLRDSGLGYKQVAKALGVPRTTLHRYMKAIPKSTEKVLALTGIP